MKLYVESITVWTGTNNLPVRVRWRQHIYRVASVQERWLYVGKWWVTPELRGQRRLYYRVVCATADGRAISMDIFRERGQWKLSRLLD